MGSLPFIPFIIGLIITAVIGLGLWRRRAQLAAWTAAAAELGIAAEPGSFMQPMKLAGDIGEVPVIVDIKREGSGDNSKTYTRYRVFYPSLGLGLRLRRESGVTLFIRIFGVQDHSIGDEVFDQAFEIKGANADAVASFLTTSRRQTLLRLQAAYPGAVITDDEIELKTGGTETSPDVIVSTVRRLAGTVPTFTGHRRPRDVEETVDRRLSGDLASSVPDAVAHAHPDDIDSSLLEIEGLYGAGRVEEAAAVVHELERVVPADPEVLGWRDQIEQPPERNIVDRAVSVDPVRVAMELFGERRLSFETTALFEERFADLKVHWAGVVRRASRNTRDRDFDHADVTKAIVHVATIENDLYGNAEVDAIVAFPPGVDIAEGQEITFTGRLVKVDGLVRNLFVADAAVLA